MSLLPQPSSSEGPPPWSYCEYSLWGHEVSLCVVGGPQDFPTHPVALKIFPPPPPLPQYFPSLGGCVKQYDLMLSSAASGFLLC